MEFLSQPVGDVKELASESNEASIFTAARKIDSADDRRVFLAEACGDDAALRERVDKLLVASAEESQFLENPAAAMLAGLIGRDIGVSQIRSLGNTLPCSPGHPLLDLYLTGGSGVSVAPERQDNTTDCAELRKQNGKRAVQLGSAESADSNQRFSLRRYYH